MKTKSIALKDIVEDDDVLVRSEINSDHLEDLLEALKQGKELPPVIVFDDGKTLTLVDGRHRCAAARKCKLDKLKAEVYEGSKRDAILFACGMNAEHGLRRTNEDKRRAVLKLLTDQEWSKWSDGKIAKKCAVSQAFVTNVRNELRDNGYEFSEIRIGVKGNRFKIHHKAKGKKTDKTEADNKDNKNLDDMQNDKENDLDDENTAISEKPPLVTKDEIMKVGAAIYNLIEKFKKVNKMIQRNKKWSKNRKAKAKSINEEISQNLIIYNKFLMKVFD